MEFEELVNPALIGSALEVKRIGGVYYLIRLIHSSTDEVKRQSARIALNRMRFLI